MQLTKSYLGIFYEFAVILDTFLTGSFFVFPLGVVFLDKIYQIFFGFYVYESMFVVNKPSADLALVFFRFSLS